MSRPSPRSALPARDDAHRKRSLTANLSPAAIAARFVGIRYGCYGKHKLNPHIYGVAPYHGQDSERTLCDAHAGFQPHDLVRVPNLFARSQSAGLVGNLIWAVDDNGWIYELQMTNAGLNEWHGYPMLPSDPFARKVWLRLKAWADQQGAAVDRDAAHACALRYGLKP